MGSPYYAIAEDVGPERALLVGVIQRGRDEWEVRDSLEELAQLTSTAGAEIVDNLIVKQDKIQPSTYIGKGKAQSIGDQVKAQKLDLVVFDEDLSPAQGRNLEQLTGVRVIDRTQMILDIFAQHARTREGSLQIELAQLEYLLPRLRHMWTHLERQKGGIGLRGPGEKQLEMDRRRIQMQLARLRKELDDVRLRRSEQRRGRRRHGWALLVLVGYTNAGKSTLLNSLTEAETVAYDQLFATLDPTTRKLELPNNQMALLTDTVGFIKKLPTHLVESFKATLEEVIEADVLLHVIDASHPQVEHQVAAVEEVLEALGANDKPCLSVLNKMDLGEAQGQVSWLRSKLPDAVKVSAKTGEGLEDLRHALADYLKGRNKFIKIQVPLAEGKLLADVRHRGRILEEEYLEDSVIIEASVPPHLYGQCQPYELHPTNTNDE